MTENDVIDPYQQCVDSDHEAIMNWLTESN